MNIYGSLMDIFDEKKQKSFMTKKTNTFVTKNKYLRRKKQKTFMSKKNENTNKNGYTLL